jgi:carbonic anhydrase
MTGIGENMMRRSIALAVAFLVAFPLLGQEQPATAPAPPPLTPDQLWSALETGNKEFQKGRITYDKLTEERQALLTTQLPPITVLACSDSRVPPELIFNQSLGALFVVRTAGNVADEFGVASIEYAIAQGYTKLIVVLAHEHCGAVIASMGVANPTTPALNALAMRIRSSFVNIPYNVRTDENVRKAIDANARSSAAQLLASSILIRDAATAARLKIVTAYYDFKTGAVTKVE